MDSHHLHKLHHLLILISLIFIQARGEDSSSGSVLFLDGSRHQFFRNDFSEKTSSLLPTDVGAAVSVLLGFAPPTSLSPHSSLKLNELLAPNPFHKPSAVIMLDVAGVEHEHHVNLIADHLASAQVGSGIRSKLLDESVSADIHLPDDDNEVSVIPLDEAIGSECDAVCMSKELQDLASWLGGSYVSSAEGPLNGEFTVTLASGTVLKLDLSNAADREFIVSVVSLVHNIKKAMEMHQVLSQSIKTPPELLTGSFTGIKTLQEQYGLDGISQQGMDLFLATLTKLFYALQDAYQGEVVGVVFSTDKPYQESESMFSVKLTSGRSSRWLEEADKSIDAIIQERLIRRILAWVTGIIFLISTILGIYFLLNMPLTRDTLLYSNVKLD